MPCSFFLSCLYRRVCDVPQTLQLERADCLAMHPHVSFVHITERVLLGAAMAVTAIALLLAGIMWSAPMPDDSMMSGPMAGAMALGMAAPLVIVLPIAWAVVRLSGKASNMAKRDEPQEVGAGNADRLPFMRHRFHTRRGCVVRRQRRPRQGEPPRSRSQHPGVLLDTQRLASPRRRPLPVAPGRSGFSRPGPGPTSRPHRRTCRRRR